MTEEQSSRESGTSEEQDEQGHEDREEPEDGEQPEQRSSAEDDEDERDEDEDEQDEEEESEDDGSSDKWAKVAGNLPVAIGALGCVAFFVWVCLQMAGQTVGGPRLLVGILGACVLGVLAAAAGMAFTKLGGD